MLSLFVAIYKVYPAMAAAPCRENPAGDKGGMFEVYDDMYKLTVYRVEDNFDSFTHPKDL